MRFNPRTNPFSQRDTGNDDGEGLPKPLTTKQRARRLAGIKEAREVLGNIPEPGECLHAIVTARLDLTDVINCLIERLGNVRKMSIATLGYNRKNLSLMQQWLESSKVDSFTLLASIFFRSHNGNLWEETQTLFRKHGQNTACCHSHAKVVALEFCSGSKFSLEGSSNLCGNGSGREQFALFRDDSLYNWHREWIDDLVKRYGG